MKIELKNIKFSEHLSEETNAFTADIFVNRKKVGYAKNDGHGGCTWYHPYSVEDRAIINEAEKYCLGLPPIKYSTLEIPMNLEHKIDQLFEVWLKKDLNKKLQKHCLKGICVETENGYRLIQWKGHTIKSILQYPKGKLMLKDKINELRREGRKVLNTNIPDEIFNN